MGVATRLWAFSLQAFYTWREGGKQEFTLLIHSSLAAAWELHHPQCWQLPEGFRQLHCGDKGRHGVSVNAPKNLRPGGTSRDVHMFCRCSFLFAV